MKNLTPWNTGGIILKDITKQCTFSWAVAPTSVTAGTFPDSFIDGSHETKLEFYSTYAGSTYQASLDVRLPKACHFMIIDDIGVGAQIGADASSRREVKIDMSFEADRAPFAVGNCWRTKGDTSFSERLSKYYRSFSQEYGDVGRYFFFSNIAGDFAFEIFQIRIIELVGV